MKNKHLRYLLGEKEQMKINVQFFHDIWDTGIESLDRCVVGFVEDDIIYSAVVGIEENDRKERQLLKRKLRSVWRNAKVSVTIQNNPDGLLTIF